MGPPSAWGSCDAETLGFFAGMLLLFWPPWPISFRCLEGWLSVGPWVVFVVLLLVCFTLCTEYGRPFTRLLRTLISLLSGELSQLSVLRNGDIYHHVLERPCHLCSILVQRPRFFESAPILGC